MPRPLTIPIANEKDTARALGNRHDRGIEGRLWGLILWNSLWGEFISIPMEVIGMATTCEDKSRAVPKVIRCGVS